MVKITLSNSTFEQRGVRRATELKCRKNISKRVHFHSDSCTTMATLFWCFYSCSAMQIQINLNFQASFMQRLVRFISSLPESIVMLELLLSPSFVFSPIIAVSRASEQVACYATESLLARQFLEVTKVITSDDVNRMLVSVVCADEEN